MSIHDGSIEAYTATPAVQLLMQHGFTVARPGGYFILERVERSEEASFVYVTGTDGEGPTALDQPISYQVGDADGPVEFSNVEAFLEAIDPERIRRWMKRHADAYRDASTGELNLTALVEAWDAAVAGGEATLDEHHIAWELAAKLEESR